MLDPIDNFDRQDNNLSPQPPSPSPTPTSAPEPNTFEDSPTSPESFSIAPTVPSNSVVPTTADTPFIPDALPKKSKKKLVAGVVAATVAIAVVGGVVFALYYNNPEKVVADALVNAVTAKTQISNGSLSFTDDKNKGKISLSFDSQSDTPNFKGQLSAKLKVDYDKYKFDIAGSGLLSENGNAYFKFDGVEKALNKYLNEPEIKAYTDQSPQLKDDIVAFAKKIDGKYIKLDKTDIKNIWEKYDYSKTKACYTNVFNELDKNPAQKQQLGDAYNSNKFIIIKNQGSENINGVDSAKYGMAVDVKKYNSASDALEKTTLAKNLQKCSDELTGQTPDTYKPTAEQQAQDQMFRDQEAASQQKQIDKTTITIWASRWDHQFTKTTLSYNDKTEKTKISVDINYKLGQKITATDPKNSISMKEFQSDINKIQADSTKGISGRAAETRNQTNAMAIQKKAEAYAAEHDGVYPTLDQLKADKGVAGLSGELAVVISADAPDAAHQDRVQYATCKNGAGYSIYYWSVSPANISFGCVAGN